MSRRQVVLADDPAACEAGDQRGAVGKRGLRRVALASEELYAEAEASDEVTSRVARIAPRLALLATDLFTVSLCELLAVSIVHQTPSGRWGSGLVANLLVGAMLPLAAVIAFWVNTLYTRWPRQLMLNTFSEVRDVIYALAVAGCVTLGLIHLIGADDLGTSIAPVTIVLALAMSASVIPVARGSVRALMRAVAAQHFRVVVVGSGTMASHLIRYLSWDPQVTVVGCVDDDPKPGTWVIGEIDDLPATWVLGGIEDLPEICAKHSVDHVIVSFSRTHPADAIQRLRAVNPRVAISIVPRYFELLTWRSSVREIAGLALIDVAPSGFNLGTRVTKRCFDLAVASLVLVLTSPLLLVTAVAVKLSSPGPALFRQSRVGRNGSTFVMFKFRTMYDDSEKRAGDPELRNVNIMDGPLFKARHDPRVTRVGRFLRRSSIDELPQLLNVIRGDMSLVGPRPFIEAESALIDGDAARRFDVRPGMTGLWQISGRSNLSYDELRRLDYLYVASWSLMWDLKILWHTPSRVLRAHGAL